jgi:esterase/lipase
MMMKFLKISLVFALIFYVVYLLGPKPAPGQYTGGLYPIKDTGAALQQQVEANESRFKLKPDNEARIVWASDSLKNRTKYAVVYLHGFTASQEEGDPVHTHFAKSIGANLYLARLSEHGKDTVDALYHMTASSLWESAKEAYSIGKQLGEKVIIIGTSTGGTLALLLAAEQYPEIGGVILYSPNIAINNPMAWMSNNPWGLQIGRMVLGGENNKAGDDRELYKKYWNYTYRVESITEVQQLLEEKMTPETFQKVNQPLLMLYYYKDEIHQDSTVKVSAMKEMFNQISTPADKKRAVALPNTGNHVIGSYIKSKDLQSVEDESLKFAREVLLKD